MTRPTTAANTAVASAAGARQLEHGQLTSLINSIADGVLAVDRFTKVTVYNGAALNILDTNSSILNRPLSDFMQLIDRNNHPVDITAYVRAVKTPRIDESLRLRYADGSAVNLYLSVAPVAQGYGSGRQHGHVVVLRDITHAKSLEEERDEFISVVSHELRTPIAITEGTIGNAQFIAEHAGDLPAIKQALEEAHEQVLFLASMINDLSTLSRAEHGKLTAEIEPINVTELLGSIVTGYQENAAKKGLVLHIDCSPQLELLHSSRLYVREILQNFITNAIKYTEQGSISLAAKPKAGGGGVVFSVTDTGIGISHADQERIFDKFFRSEDYRTRQHNGTGLGLYITLKLARLLHADIGVSSRPDAGSTFTVSVPDLG